MLVNSSRLAKSNPNRCSGSNNGSGDGGGVGNMVGYIMAVRWIVSEEAFQNQNKKITSLQVRKLEVSFGNDGNRESVEILRYPRQAGSSGERYR
jgi:hypothetical protein